MDAADILRDSFGRIREQLHHVLDGLLPEQLSYRPHVDANSIAWLAWHLTRVHDDHMSEIAGNEQAWISDGWSEKFGMEPDPHNQGTGHTSADVAAIKPDSDLLLAYQDAVLARTNQYLQTVSPEELERIIDRRWDPPVTVGARIVSVINDNTEHAGQAAYLRGLIEERRWYFV
jgi:uncharacterized damage-inducible protein DinB